MISERERCTGREWNSSEEFRKGEMREVSGGSLREVEEERERSVRKIDPTSLWDRSTVCDTLYHTPNESYDDAV